MPIIRTRIGLYTSILSQMCPVCFKTTDMVDGVCLYCQLQNDLQRSMQADRLGENEVSLVSHIVSP